MYKRQKKRRRFLLASGAGVLISFLLALGHVLYGRELMNYTTQVALLDHYLFYLATAFVILTAFLYFSYFRDISESLAVIATGLFALYSGLEDIFVYLLMGYFEPTYPWLKGTIPGFLSGVIGSDTVTTPLLLLNVAYFGAITSFVVYLLYKLEMETELFEI